MIGAGNGRIWFENVGVDNPNEFDFMVNTKAGEDRGWRGDGLLVVVGYVVERGVCGRSGGFVVGCGLSWEEG